MKSSKILAFIQLSLMYIGLILVFVASFIPGGEDNSAPIAALVITGIVSISIASILATIICIISLVSIFKNSTADNTKFVMIYKFIAIPWFIANFVLCVLLIAGMLNPFLFFAIPVVVIILSLSTYINMISTSAINLGYVLSSFRRKTLRPNALLIIGTIFGFIFCLDFIGAIFVYKNNKNQLNKQKMTQASH